LGSLQGFASAAPKAARVKARTAAVAMARRIENP
jgi:hypothetical protein